MDLKDLSGKRARLAFDFDGESVAIEYYPHRITPDYLAQLVATAEQTTETSIDQDAQLLTQLLASWDVLFDGQPFPPTYENLLRVPKPLILRSCAEITHALGKLATRNGANG